MVNEKYYNGKEFITERMIHTSQLGRNVAHILAQSFKGFDNLMKKANIDTVNWDAVSMIQIRIKGNIDRYRLRSLVHQSSKFNIGLDICPLDNKSLYYIFTPYRKTIFDVMGYTPTTIPYDEIDDLYDIISKTMRVVKTINKDEDMMIEVKTDYLYWLNLSDLNYCCARKNITPWIYPISHKYLRVKLRRRLPK